MYHIRFYCVLDKVWDFLLRLRTETTVGVSNSLPGPDAWVGRYCVPYLVTVEESIIKNIEKKGHLMCKKSRNDSISYVEGTLNS